MAYNEKHNAANGEGNREPGQAGVTAWLWHTGRQRNAMTTLSWACGSCIAPALTHDLAGDGSNDNFSWNCGVEGPTDNAAVNALRQKQARMGRGLAAGHVVKGCRVLTVTTAVGSAHSQFKESTRAIPRSAFRPCLPHTRRCATCTWHSCCPRAPPCCS